MEPAHKKNNAYNQRFTLKQWDIVFPVCSIAWFAIILQNAINVSKDISSLQKDYAYPNVH